MYTYLIGWSKHNVWYYGGRTANQCPAMDDIWNDYYTSSTHVKSFREEHGEPDVIKIHKLFETKDEVWEYEERFLKRVRREHPELWLNKCNGYSGWVCKGHSEEARARMRQSSCAGSMKSLDEIKKMQQGFSKKYQGYTNAGQVPELRAKVADTLSKRYGVDNASKIPEVREKIGKMKRGQIHIIKGGKRKMIDKEQLSGFEAEGWRVGFGKSYERVYTECPHCGKSADQVNVKRWHGDNCKLRPFDL